jgi:hypothetical protein
MSWARIAHARPYVEQWQRVLRWQDRLSRVVAESYGDANLVVDHALAVLQNCFYMRDWLVRSVPEREQSIARAFASDALRLCRDLVNGSKHLEINHPSVDARHSVRASYVPPPLDGSAPASYELFVAANGELTPLLDLCRTCVAEVDAFLEIERLSLPEQR